ncbi:MAG: DedA family protein [Polyangiaceae bacterium]
MFTAAQASTLGQCGYLAVGIGTYVEGEAVLVSAGAVAHAGLLSLPLVVLAAALGSFAWGQTWFRLGRVSGPRLIARRPAWQARAARAERWLSRSGVWFLLVGRFCLGLGTVLPALVGASGYAWRRFVVVDAIGALIWATVFAGVGFGGAAGLRHLLGNTFAI